MTIAVHCGNWTNQIIVIQVMRDFNSKRSDALYCMVTELCVMQNRN